MQRRVTLAALASLGALAFGVYACSSDETGETATGTSVGGNGGTGPTSTTSSNNGGSDVSVGSQVGGSTGEGGACADLVVEAEIEFKPADIVFVIDNSGSMTSEIAGVEMNVNVNFAGIIQASGVDYQVIMVTDHGSSTSEVCIGPPLSGTTNCAGPPIEVPGKFYHYDVNVQSTDPVCTLMDTLYGSNAGGRPVEAGSDPNSIYLAGWNTFLRAEAVKVLVVISDDRVNCTCPGTYCTSPGLSGTTLNDQNTSPGGQTAALDFDNKLLQIAPAQFGTSAARNYIYYAIVGIAPKPAPNQLQAYTEFEPIVTTNCVGGVNPGYGHQWLAKGTGALRFPVCQDQAQTFDAVFQDIAAGVIDITKVPCEFDVPAPPPGQELDLDTIDVLYTPGGGGPTQEWTKVDSESQCGPGKFWIDETVDPPRIHLCDAACDIVEADSEAKLEVKIECGGMQT